MKTLTTLLLLLLITSCADLDPNDSNKTPCSKESHIEREYKGGLEPVSQPIGYDRVNFWTTKEVSEFINPRLVTNGIYLAVNYEYFFSDSGCTHTYSCPVYEFNYGSGTLSNIDIIEFPVPYDLNMHLFTTGSTEYLIYLGSY